MKIRKLIKEQLLLEKRISQMVSNLNIRMSLDLIKHGKGHANERGKGKGREDVDGYDMRPVNNSEIKYFVESFKTEIAEAILYGDIENEEPFVISSERMGLAIPLKPIKNSNLHWDLVIMTVFRISPENPFRVGDTQFVIKK